MKIFLTVAASCFLFTFSNSQNKFFKAVTVVFPYSPDGSKDSTTIFYAPDMVIHKMHNHYSTSSISPADDGNPGIQKVIDSGEYAMYFAYDPQKKYGIMFNTIVYKLDTVGNGEFLTDTIKERMVLVDSFLKRNQSNFHLDLRNINLDSSKLIISSDQKYNYIESYTSKYKSMGISGDSAILYFNKDFIDIEYDLAKTKENKLPYKLQKIRMVYNVEGDKLRDVKSFKVERTYELRKVNDKEFEDAAYYYQIAKNKL
jgi:hypothetical protein